MIDQVLISQFEKLLGKDGALSTPEDLAVYGYDGTFEDHQPDLVLLPRSTEQVSQVVQLAAAERLPLVTRGMGSGLAAASVPFQGGIVLAMTRMNRILEIDPVNATVLVEAGVITAHLQAAVEKLGLSYPPDPSSIRHSTIGGNIACNAGGPHCLKYGVTANHVSAAKVVLADGELVELCDEDGRPFDPPVMGPRMPEDRGPYFKLYPEGRIVNFDGRNVPAPHFLADNPYDFNRNFPYAWAPEPQWSSRKHPRSTRILPPLCFSAAGVFSACSRCPSW